MPRVTTTKSTGKILAKGVEILNENVRGETNKKVSERILDLSRKGIEEGKEHFRVGHNRLYFPKARVILLRPNAKHTPYQAKFIVPKSFNKLDLRDYLYHLYGLRAMNVTTQLLPGTYNVMNRLRARFRGPQIKKMTIDMEEPFIWPEEPDKSVNQLWETEYNKEMKKLERESMEREGSDKLKPSTAFGGVLGPYGLGAQPFIPKFFKKQLDNDKRKYFQREKLMARLNNLQQYVDGATPNSGTL
ncbi:hypothetical protein NCAS_0A12050 [Naumovozyma castellii]|uniref:Large ribosomal subunit protein uL23m n=1 Tax=Naumovozyma castellii TaxID=27288 RepID=G0V8G5_NAUCA|nr:hypothetical protein NCAS_0A12050 [Naumovozyma castellii CBS 4309]CCC67763.1 hypothetical protein NCAS_0A12050 [Naumovozyma castellii CBS 4309]